MSITNQHIFDELKDLRLELKQDMKDLKLDVDQNTTFRNQLVGKMTAIFAIIGIGVNLLWDYIFNRKA